MIDTKEFIDKILDKQEQENRNKQAKQQLVIDFLNDCIKHKVVFKEAYHNFYKYHRIPYTIELSIHKSICYIKFIEMTCNRESTFDTTIDNEKILPFLEYLQSFSYKIPDNILPDIFNNVNEIKQKDKNIYAENKVVILDFLISCIQNKIIFIKEQGNEYTNYSYQDENCLIQLEIDSNLDNLSYFKINKNNYHNVEVLSFIGHQIFFFIDYLNKTAIEESKNE